MLEILLKDTVPSDFILEHSPAVSWVTERTDPQYERFRDNVLRPARESDDIGKKVAGVSGSIVAGTVYTVLETVARAAEMAARGVVKAGSETKRVSAPWLHRKWRQYRALSGKKQAGIAASVALVALLGATYFSSTVRSKIPILPPTDGPVQGHINQRVQNTNGYVITVNGQNTTTLQRLGWLQNGRHDYTILDRSGSRLAEAERELNEGNYGVLVITGHHHGGSSTIYGDGGERLDLNNLPRSTDIEVVMFSACKTTPDTWGNPSNVYAALQRQFPNLKAVVGFRGSALANDGVIPGVMNIRRYLQGENGLRRFAQAAIEVNPVRVGVATRAENGTWEYHTAGNTTNVGALQ